MSDWPKNPDGSNKRMGEMTPAERREQWQAAGRRLEARFPEIKAGFATVLGPVGYIPPKETAWVNEGVYAFARRLRKSAGDKP